MSRKGIVAAGHELTVEAAETILRNGGNAFDAILAAHFAACVTEPVLASLGGGGFLIAQPAGREPVVYDFFVQTPRQKRAVGELDFEPIMADFGPVQQEFHIGQGTITTPGSVKGIFAIHQDLGSLPLKEIVAPAVHFARQGVRLNKLQAYIFSVVSPIYLATPESREIYCSESNPDQMPGEGEAIRQVHLADTIEQLAAEGADLFYRGELAREIVRQCRDGGGHLSREDLEQYQVVKRKPLDVEYRGAHLMTNPPPSSGGILIAFALELLKTVDSAGWNSREHAYLRLLAEVMAVTNKARIDALAQNSKAADETLGMLDPQYLELYRKEVARRAQAIRGTTHINVIDAQGNIAAMTVSNGEGCGAIVPNTGLMLNNMLGEQDLNFEGFHLWPENQRMTSMMAPSLIRIADGSMVATGSGGSNRIRSALLQMMIHLIDFGMDVHSAVVHPRLHLEGEKLSVEGGFPAAEVERLIADYPDHEVWTELNLFFGGAHTVLAGNGKYDGAGDPRRGGVCRVVE